MTHKKLSIKQIQASETWPLRHVVMYPTHPKEYVILENDKEGIHFGGYAEGILVTVVSLFIKEKNAQFRKLATLEEHQGKGYASQLLSFVFDFSKKKNTSKIWCNARENKANFYHNFGMTKTNKTYKESGINFVIMEVNY
ncbi:GNAT family N-acetyltransferase [Maribacter vaceletii]|uniref:GNAT family N-acetyltransferase n=1 Tax=Maribacter vaceletii TaxID=1206816 RepID=UPI001FE97B15|nr:GNAT family N-acetyltransferase [Maribacter vaceletii]